MLRGASTAIAVKLATVPIAEVCICSVVVAELLYGAHRSASAPQALRQVRAFLPAIPIASVR
ncbi:MAG: type II toxin-antitoxin system VapC family toxin [Pirellulales bacterium]|nr:type II toxin-antitoxin system VapC family toxin [Pirellulales bacterium]